MLEIDIKILPYGSRENSKLLHRITITNDATGNAEIGNYHASLRNAVKGRVLKTCEITDFPRLDKNAIHLLYLVLRKFIRSYDVRYKKNVQAAIEKSILSEPQAQTSDPCV